MEKKYQVFVSSTYQDLIEERDEVMKSLLELDCIPCGMELFPSSDDEALNYIKKVIDNCDYFISVVAGRYGSEHMSGKSYTQLEYEYACSKNIPTLAFINKTPENLPANKYELDPEKRIKLSEFQNLIQKKLCRYWTTKGELSALVSRSMVKLMKDKPQPGWIRQSENKELDFQSLILTKLQELEKRNEIIVKNQTGSEPLIVKIDNLKYEKLELEIVKLSHSIIYTNSYAVILGLSNSRRKLTITIGGFEAQALAVAIEKLTTNRPLTHALLFNIISQTQYFVKEIVIYDFIDGIFHTKIVITDNYNILEIESRTSDALTIAVLSNAPIFISNLVFDTASVEPDEDK